ncbi:DinB family protein [Terrabacter sp. 2RAF25]|uniref:DinB family protein n=1 Tax=Terrabacter sp. 2RAF25 TaxID=3232998 RepID=UPI003F989DEF
MPTPVYEHGRRPPVDRAATRAGLLACRDDLHRLLAGASPGQLRAASNGTAWTNEQLLFHMVFGFLVVRRLLPLVRFLGRRPRWVGSSFARLLDAARVPFHWVNYAGSCGGALVFDRKRMGRLCDRTIASLVRSLESETAQRLDEGMPFPPSWDPYFTSFMTLAEVYAYPELHYRHHRAQLTLQGVDLP